MNRNSQAMFQKWLLIFTVLIVAAFVFTWPTRDRRGMIDRIRLQVGAGHLVSKKTLKEIAAEERAAGRRPASAAIKLDARAQARGKNSAEDQKDRLVRSVTFYCNQEYDRTACAQWLNYCGESCKMLVRPDMWSNLAANTRTKGH